MRATQSLLKITKQNDKWRHGKLRSGKLRNMNKTAMDVSITKYIEGWLDHSICLL